MALANLKVKHTCSEGIETCSKACLAWKLICKNTMMPDFKCTPTLQAIFCHPRHVQKNIQTYHQHLYTLSHDLPLLQIHYLTSSSCRPFQPVWIAIAHKAGCPPSTTPLAPVAPWKLPTPKPPRTILSSALDVGTMGVALGTELPGFIFTIHGLKSQIAPLGSHCFKAYGDCKWLHAILNTCSSR